jgi:O-antigen/teichoic acid export membrane protein
MKKILKRYKNIAAPAKASLWFMIASILQNGISFITVPIFTRLLSTKDFGLVSVYQSWLSIITIFATLTLWGGVFNNGMFKYEEDRNSFVSSLQGLATFVTISMLILFGIFSDTISAFMGISKSLIILMFVQINFTTALYLWSAKQRFDYKYKKLVLVTIIISIANPIVGLFLIFQLDNGGIARIISIAVVHSIIGGILYITNVIKGKKFYDKIYWKYAFMFNLPLIPHFLSQSILNQSDRIMINLIVGTDKAGIYSLAYSIGMILLFIITSINSTLTPWTYRRLKDKSYRSISETSNYLLIVLSLLILVVVAIAPEIIQFIAPPQYSEAIWSIPPIALSLYFIFLYGLFANVEFYFEENKFIVVASVIVTIINLILNYIFINVFGYLAAAYTTLISYVFICIMHFLFIRKILNERKISDSVFDFKKILLISIAMLTINLCIMLTYRMIYLRLVIILICIAIIYNNKNRFKTFLTKLKI